ncbi:MAG: hypothetical protein FWG63_11125 [Defluviitaleaceae bacterium]|nr:hypothetical protein [Defluviitaleaceae bacterium]
MQTLFTVAFGVGLGYTVISLVLGNLLDMGDFDNSAFSPLRPAPISAFLVVFGGVGMLFYESLGFTMVLIISAFLGVVISYLVIRFVLMPLHRAQNTSTVDRQSLVGHHAVVQVKIPQNGFGKISLNVNGSNVSSPAKSEDSNEISTGTTVEIVSIERNIYFVKTAQ